MGASIPECIASIRAGIGAKARACGREPEDITLMAATKYVSEHRIMEAIDGGITAVGENYVQEAAKKKTGLERAGRIVAWHMIGRLQTNKAKYAVRLFDTIHSLDRIELAIELDRRSKAIGKIMKVLIEVNTGGEATKSGVFPDRTQDLVLAASRLPHLSVVGLMTIPPWSDDPERSRPYFKALRELGEEINVRHFPGVQMKELSMGMTDDFLVAVEEGATIVRIGRGIFGERRKP